MKKKKEKEVKVKLHYRKELMPYFFIAPNMILFLVFVIVPIIFTFCYSFTKWNGLGPKVFVGFDNYVSIFKNSTFLTSLKNTFLYTFCIVPLEMILGLLLAILLNKGFVGRGPVRAIVYLPCMISTVITGLAFSLLFNTNLGLVNYLLKLGGQEKIAWFTDRKYAFILIIITSIWHNVGAKMVIYLGALQGVDKELYEASTVDGANSFQKFLYVTLPCLKGTNLFVMITSVISSFKSFDIIYTMTGGGPRNGTSTLALYIYNTAFVNGNFGRASAGGVILFMFLLIFTLVRFKTQKEK